MNPDPNACARASVRRRRLAFAAAVMLAVAGTAAGADENLVRNGGFEKGLDGWTVNDETSSMKADIDTKVRAEGKASAHLVKPAAKGIANDRLQFELKKVPAGKTVAVSVKLKGKDVQNTWVKLFAYDESGESILEDCDVGRVSGTFDWKPVARSIEIPKAAVRAELRVCMFLGGELWIDDVRVAGDASAAKDTTAAETGRAKAPPLDGTTRTWLDANAVKIATLDAKAPFDDLRPLREILKDARIVQLGENTHGDGACFEAKARLVRFLHEEMGFDVLAFESGMWECDRANELLRRGDGAGAMKASIFPIWHTVPVSGMFRWLAERAKTDRPMTLAGFDCRRSAGKSNRFLAALAEFVGTAGAPADVAPLEKLEAQLWEQGDEYRPGDADLKVAAAAWDALRTAFDANRAKLVAKHGEAETAFVSRALDDWKANEAFERSKGDKSLGEWGSNNLRDAQMAANLRWLADVRHPGKKIVTWGATFHLARALPSIEVQGRPKMYDGCANMGGAVHEAFGKQVFTIGFAAWGGKAGLRFNPKPFALSAPKEGSVEDRLHRYGAPFLFLDLRRDGPFSAKTHLSVLAYDRGMQAAWAEVIDGVVFIDEMTPAR